MNNYFSKFIYLLIFLREMVNDKSKQQQDEQIKTLKQIQGKMSDEKAKKAIEEKIKRVQKPFNK